MLPKIVIALLFLTFSANAQSFKLDVTGNINIPNDEPYLIWYEDDQAIDARIWDMYVSGGTLRLGTANDSYTTSSSAMEINRSGNSISTVAFPNGNVGIGTASPSNTLHVYNGDVRIQSGANGSFGNVFFGKSNKTSKGIGAGSGTMNIWVDSSSNHGFHVRSASIYGTSRFFVDTLLGNVGIGTTSPGFKLEVNGSIGNGGTTHHASDRRLKKNIIPLAHGLSKIMALRGVVYEWKKPLDRPMEGAQIGVIAQEVQQIIPEAVLVAQDDIKTLSVNYDALTPLLIEAVKELKAELDDLKATLNRKP